MLGSVWPDGLLIPARRRSALRRLYFDSAIYCEAYAKLDATQASLQVRSLRGGVLHNALRINYSESPGGCRRHATTFISLPLRARLSWQFFAKGSK